MHDLDVAFSINGGIATYEDCQQHLSHGLAGVMVGRAFIADPFYWSQIDSKIYNTTDQGLTRRQLIEEYAKYAERVEIERGPRSRRPLVKVFIDMNSFYCHVLSCFVTCVNGFQPVLSLFTGLYGGRAFRNQLDVALRASPVSSVVVSTNTKSKALRRSSKQQQSSSKSTAINNDVACVPIPVYEPVAKIIIDCMNRCIPHELLDLKPGEKGFIRLSNFNPESS